MKRQSIMFTEPQNAYLEAEAERLGISISDLVRRIIDHYRANIPAHQALRTSP